MVEDYSNEVQESYKNIGDLNGGRSNGGAYGMLGNGRMIFVSDVGCFAGGKRALSRIACAPQNNLF